MNNIQKLSVIVGFASLLLCTIFTVSRGGFIFVEKYEYVKPVYIQNILEKHPFETSVWVTENCTRWKSDMEYCKKYYSDDYEEFLQTSFVPNRKEKWFLEKYADRKYYNELNTQSAIPFAFLLVSALTFFLYKDD